MKTYNIISAVMNSFYLSEDYFIARLKRMLKMISLLFFTNVLLAQDKVPDETKLSGHFLYIVPTSAPGNMMDLNNFWIQTGYGWLKSRSMYCFDLGVIVLSMPTSGGGYAWSNLTQISSNGYALSFEHKYFITKRFYYASQINFQHMKTKRDEITPAVPQGKSSYFVFRNEIGFIPKIGFAFITKGKLSCDIGLGVGIRYISSKSQGKLNPSGNLQKEYFANKVFDSGNRIAQRIMFQFRVGYTL